MILILLTILKIIGIILLIFLGLLILLLCLVLFAPVRYRAKGAKHPEELSVNAYVSYLWPLVRLKAAYPSETVLSVKILWFDLMHPKDKKKKRAKSDKKPKASRTPADETGKYQKQEDDIVKPMRAVTEPPVYQTEMLSDEDVVKNTQSKSKEKASGKKNISEQKQDTDKKTDKSRNQKTGKKPSQKEKSVPYAEKEAENKLVALAALLWQYKEMYPDVLERVFHALRSVLPHKCHIHLIFGTGSPDNTGYLYGAYCALQQYLPGTIIFEPVWMESYLDVEFELSGNIRLIHFVTAAVKIIADKRVRKFVSEIRRL